MTDKPDDHPDVVRAWCRKVLDAWPGTVLTVKELPEGRPGANPPRLAGGTGPLR